MPKSSDTSSTMIPRDGYATFECIWGCGNVLSTRHAEPVTYDDERGVLYAVGVYCADCKASFSVEIQFAPREDISEA
jgi:hypothetical protein